jgi:hypothetical protein
VGPNATVPSGTVRFDSNLNSIAIQIVSKVDRFKKDLPDLENFEIKYG